MRTDRAVTRPSSEPVFMRPIVDRQTPVKTLPSLAVGNNYCCLTVADLGFPRGGTKTRGSANLSCGNFCRKLHENERDSNHSLSLPWIRHCFQQCCSGKAPNQRVDLFVILRKDAIHDVVKIPLCLTECFGYCEKNLRVWTHQATAAASRSIEMHCDAPKSVPDPFPNSDAYLDAYLDSWRLTLGVFIA